MSSLFFLTQGVITMCMKRLLLEGNYELVEHENSITPFAVFKYIEDAKYWHQVSKWYFYKGCALRELRKQLRKDELRSIQCV